MKKRVSVKLITLIFLTITVSFTGLLNVYAGKPDGSLENPFEIKSWTDLANIGSNPQANYVLTTNLNQKSKGYSEFASCSANNGAGWIPLMGEGGAWNLEGTFDGKGYTISDFCINNTYQEMYFSGFFGYGSPTTLIKNLILSNATVYDDASQGFAGIFAGSYTGSATNIRVDGTVYCNAENCGGFIGAYEGDISTWINDSISNVNVIGGVEGNNIGGFIGLLPEGNIYNCSSKGNITGSYYLGGFVGSSDGGGSIAESYSKGFVNSFNGTSIGGFLGMSNGLRFIYNSYSTGNVVNNGETGSFIGGFVGSVENTLIQNSYSTGLVKNDVTSPEYTGGFVGYFNNETGYIINSFWDINTSNQIISTGATGKTTEEMKNIQTFLDANWSIALKTNLTDQIWFIEEGIDYPRLRTELQTIPTKIKKPRK